MAALINQDQSESETKMNEKIAVVGLGYVGLPLAVALAKKTDGVVGFDISDTRVSELNSNFDRTREISEEELEASALTITSDSQKLSEASFIIVTVPTPIDEENRPDLGPIASSCRTIAPLLQKNAVVVFESTVYPGVTDDICAKLLEKHSNLVRGKDFFLGYSPERINPGDKVHTLESIVKIVAAEDAPTLDRLKSVYGSIIEAGLHIAPSIKVAEAAKVIENTQRDLNIALMNELSFIFEKMDIRTKDVLEAAGTKWNFLKFTPGLVGGHCIGVDPYYITTAAQRLGYQPEVILAGRRINDQMGHHVGQKVLKMYVRSGGDVRNAKIGILGLTFKENVPDIRNSKVPDIIDELVDYGLQPLIHDPHADADEVMEEYGLQMNSLDEFADLDIVILAVPHSAYLENTDDLMKRIKKDGAIVDLKSLIEPSKIRENLSYWSL